MTSECCDRGQKVNSRVYCANDISQGDVRNEGTRAKYVEAYLFYHVTRLVTDD